MNVISYSDLFWTFLKINTFTFGGGYTIVPVIRDEFMKKKKLIDEEEMLKIVALAQSSPGPMAISASILTGYRVKGPLGAIVSLLASVLPCLVIITIMYYIYDMVKDNTWVQAGFSALSGIISAVLFFTVIEMAQTATKKHRIFSYSLILIAFILSFFHLLPTIAIIILMAVIGLVTFSFFKEDQVK